MTLSQTNLTDLKNMCFTLNPEEYIKIIEPSENILFCERHKASQFYFGEHTKMSGMSLECYSVNELRDIDVFTENEMKVRL